MDYLYETDEKGNMTYFYRTEGVLSNPLCCFDKYKTKRENNQTSLQAAVKAAVSFLNKALKPVMVVLEK